MTDFFRKLNDTGLNLFSEYIKNGAKGPPPKELLVEKETSDELPYNINPGEANFENRYDLGVYLKELLSEFDPMKINWDMELWSSLALHWFDDLCMRKKDGSRNAGAKYRFILTSDYNTYYRHLVRTPWRLVSDYGSSARLMLISPDPKRDALSNLGDLLEHILSRQHIARNPTIVEMANKLYFDKKTNRPRKNITGEGGGGPRRFGVVMRQFELTYDPEETGRDAFINILPSEFDRWKT